MKSRVAASPAIGSAVRAQHRASFVLILKPDMTVIFRKPNSSASASARAAGDRFSPISKASRTE